ncbi:hypothetical protein D3C77_367550 [compost metagenome]
MAAGVTAGLRPGIYSGIAAQPLVQIRSERDIAPSAMLDAVLRQLRVVLYPTRHDALPTERRRPWRITAEQTGREVIERRTLPIFLGEHSIRFGELPVHLQAIALFKVNIRCYKQEVRKLRWY